MNIKNYRIDKGAIIQIQDSIKPKEWSEKADWVDIRANNRSEIEAFFNEHQIIEKGKDSVKHPEANPALTIFGDLIILNFTVSEIENIYKPDYVTIIIMKTLLVSILPLELNSPLRMLKSLVKN